MGILQKIFKKQSPPIKDIEGRSTFFSITPKGIIHLALGGYVTEGVDEKSKLIVSQLSEFMERNNFGIITEDGNLTFIEIKK